MRDFSFRRDLITKPIFRMAQHALPSLSDTEREAIEAGDVWWDADLFTGNPDWDKLLAFPPATLVGRRSSIPRRSGRRTLRACSTTGRINWEWHDLPPEVWDFLKANKFFAMIIPEAVRRARLFRLRAFGGDPQAVVAFAVGCRDRDGAELARPRRTADAIRHQGAAGLLAAAARAGGGNSLLRPDQPGGRIGRRLDDRFRRRLPRHVRRHRTCSASG